MAACFAMPYAWGQQPPARAKGAKAVQLAKVVAPPDVRYIQDIAYREGDPAWKLDLAAPKERGAKPRPGIVIFHGGGWSSGDKRTGVFATLPIDYAKHGYVAISINYRLTPSGATMANCVEDVKCAVRWFRAHAEEYNLDPKRIGAFGNSAGAHLTAMLALAGPEAKLEGDGPYQDQSSAIQAACPSATPTDFLHWKSAGDSGQRFESRIQSGSQDTAEQQARRVSPITYVNAAAPPMLVIQGNADNTVPFYQAEHFVKALRDAGAKKVTFLIVDGASHSVFTMNSPITNGAMMAFFDSTIGPDAKK